MKRIVHPDISQKISFEENFVHAWVVENPTFFRALVSDLHVQMNGEEGKFVLSDDYKSVDIAKHMDLITQFIPFELNRKNLLAKICAAAEREAVNEQNYAHTQGLLAEIERYTNDLLFAYPYDFVYDKLTIGNLFKSIGIAVEDHYDREIERILDYMQLVREFDRDRIFVFVNLRSYFSTADLETFFRDALARKFHLWLIDNREYPRLPGEQRFLIDEDLCEIF